MGRMEETKNYLKEIISRFEFSQIKEQLDKLNNLSVLVIGDTIIDHYVFVEPKGRAIKDPILSVEYKNREVYAGGIIAIANHLSDFVKKIKLITLIGDQNSHLNFINKSIKENTELKFFVKDNSSTTVKKRMIDHYRNNKLFKIEYINDEPLSKEMSEEIITYLDEEISKYDLVIVGDFGHGFINEGMRRVLEEKSKFLAINAQSNSSNMGYNYFNLYKKFDFMCTNEEELRLPLYMKFEDIDEVIKKIHESFNINSFLVTRGTAGCTFFNKGIFIKSPIVSKSVRDTIGAGDALFAIASLLKCMKIDDQLVPFIGNCAGGIAANIMGNKESITKENLLNFIKEVYQNELGRI